MTHAKTPVWALLPLSLAMLPVWAASPDAALSDIVVSATIGQQANTATLNPKAAIQPAPAQDGADLLKTVPNMSVIRKGGTSGDPLFRGLGGSRLNITADDQYIFGGCGGRMDPPTAYIFPAAYDEVIITKGPQTVTQGAGLVAGSVRFVRQDPHFDETTVKANGALTVGSPSRVDAYLDGTVGNQWGWLRANVTHSQADDYKDGDGQRVHSEFDRTSQMLQAALTPGENTTVAATYERSRGEAAYGDRMMDGSKFDRDAWNLKWTQRNLTDWLDETVLQYGESKVDHVMDNYSLRTKPAGQMYMANNPDRRTDTAHAHAKMSWDSISLQTGFDWMQDRHRFRGGRGMSAALADQYANNKRDPRQSFRQWGLYAEGAWQRSENQKWVAGLRHDKVNAIYETMPASNALRDQDYNLNAGFVRWEQQINGIKYYAGLGLAERSPDFWERNRSQTLKKERTQQLDAGMMWQNNQWQTALSVFGGRINDFILVDNNSTSGARNIDARRYGFEAEANWQFAPQWKLGSSLAYTYGKNTTDGVALAQTPPLEWKTHLNWENERFSAGALWRVAAAQNRYAKGQGNIAGQDSGPTGGFGVLSLNGSWKINKHFSLQAGVDNVLNKTYAESVNKSSYDVAAGMMQTSRINEPGRQAWLRLQGTF